MSWTVERFTHEMHKFDPLLRVRLSKVQPEFYLVERKATRESLCRVPPKERRGIDAWVRDKDGFVHVMKVRRDLLNQYVFLELRAHDMWQFKHSGWFADQLEAQEAREQEAVDRRQHTILQDQAGEAYEQLAWREGRRVAISR